MQLALLSVSDKSGIVELAHVLVTQYGFQLLSSGGTAQTLRAAGITVTSVADHTGAPEILGGRVKTLHPRIHGGILARFDLPEDQADLQHQQIPPIKLVVVNLYPFAATIAKPDTTPAEAIEQIDIGGPTLVRAAAKNHAHVTILTDPDQYSTYLQELQDHGEPRASFRLWCAQQAFSCILTYDQTIATYFDRLIQDPQVQNDLQFQNDPQLQHNPQVQASDPKTPDPKTQDPKTQDLKTQDLKTQDLKTQDLKDPQIQIPSPTASPAQSSADPLLPPVFQLQGSHHQSLRYGENPHQQAVWYEQDPLQGWSGAKQIQGKDLSYNNLVDLEAARRIAAEFVSGSQPTAVVIKHTNPCGVACRSSLPTAYQAALAADPVSAFGGIVALTHPIDAATAQSLTETFLECVVSPGCDPEVEAILSRKKNLRVLILPDLTQGPTYSIRLIAGGFLLQDADQLPIDPATWKSVTDRQPTPTELEELAFAWRVCKHVKSNAIVISRDQQTIGIGAGQMNRVGSVQIALAQAGDRAQGSVLASDAFFPFDDSVRAAAAAGVTAIVQPGGSLRDQESIEAANELGVAMVMTGIRHFYH